VQYLEIDHFREDLLCTRKHTKDDFLLSAAIAVQYLKIDRFREDFP